MKFSQAKACFVVGLAVGLTFSGIGVTASAQNNFGPDPFANHYSGEGAVPNTQNGPRATNPFLAGLFGFISDSARSFRPATRTTFGAGPGNFAGNPGFTNGSGLANSGFSNSAGFQGGGFQGGGFQGGGFQGGGFQGG
ncbi:MAG: hypothetical protein O7C63_09810, partial [Alphaproteobacteria bacterium]|nr:hypothetical protein [Alphaproteobacteria bacterium]